MVKRKNVLFAVIVFCLFAYLTMTPVGALRLCIALSGHPVSAVTAEIGPESYDFSQGSQIGFSLTGSEPGSVPYEKATDSYLRNWVVTPHGIFYTADYFGWG